MITWAEGNDVSQIALLHKRQQLLCNRLVFYVILIAHFLTIALFVLCNVTYSFGSHISLASLISTQVCGFRYHNESQVTLDTSVFVSTSLTLAKFDQHSWFHTLSLPPYWIALLICNPVWAPLLADITKWQLLFRICHSDCALNC